jgi:hypothetical protein
MSDEGNQECITCDSSLITERGPIAQMRLERTPDKREVGSSTLPRPTSIREE